MERIYFNGRILTMTHNSQEDAVRHAPQAVSVRDGRILRVGDLAEMRYLAGDDAVCVDLEGKCLAPGFIDAHSHFAMHGRILQQADLSACDSFESVIRTLKDYIRDRQITPDQGVLAFGYDLYLLPGHPDKRILDQVSTEIPIFAAHISSHLGCANSAALRLAGVDATTPDPANGVVGRMEGSMEPNGYFEEGGLGLIRGKVGSRVSFPYERTMADSQARYLSYGVTTVQDGATSPVELDQLRSFSGAGKLKIDVVAYPMAHGKGPEMMAASPDLVQGYADHLRIGGYKMVLDGSPQGRSAWMSQPYLNGPADYCGYPVISDEVALERASLAVREGKQLLCHCNGDAACEQFIRVYEQALAAQGKDAALLRPVMIHCQTVRNDQLDRMTALNMAASIFVGHVWYWGDVHLMNFGPRRGHHISPVRDALDRGLHVTFHQDAPVTSPDMLHSIWCAVNRISRDGVTVGEDQKVSAYQAMRCATIEGAWQYGEENEKGTIEAGKRADLVILDRSPLEVDPMAIRDIRVLETIKDGETVYQA